MPLFQMLIKWWSKIASVLNSAGMLNRVGGGTGAGAYFLKFSSQTVYLKNTKVRKENNHVGMEAWVIHKYLFKIAFTSYVLWNDNLKSHLSEIWHGRMVDTISKFHSGSHNTTVEIKINTFVQNGRKRAMYMELNMWRQEVKPTLPSGA